jgi:hypothetical protein
LNDEGAIKRVLQRVRGRRRFGPQDSGWEENEKERLGGEVLFALADLLGDPSLLEPLRLYLGSDVEPIILLYQSFDGAREQYIIDTSGCLVYSWKDTCWDREEIQMQEERKVKLEKASDFCYLNLESVMNLHRNVMNGDLWERLAWSLGRLGKPGYREYGYEEEMETWRVKSADPGEHTHKSRWRRRDETH